MNVNVDDAEFARRRAEWKPKVIPAAKRGVLRKYTQLVSSASTGCVTDL